MVGCEGFKLTHRFDIFPNFRKDDKVTVLACTVVKYAGGEIALLFDGGFDQIVDIRMVYKDEIA